MDTISKSLFFTKVFDVSLHIIMFLLLISKISQIATNSLLIFDTSLILIVKSLSFKCSNSVFATSIVKVYLLDIISLSKIFSAFSVIVCLLLNPVKFNSLEQLIAVFIPLTFSFIFISYPIKSSSSKSQYSSFNSK